MSDTVPDPVRRMLDDDLASRTLGIRLVDAGPGHATVGMTITETMVNGHALAHGGYVFLLADTAFACACNSHGPVTVAAGADITFVTGACPTQGTRVSNGPDPRVQRRRWPPGQHLG